MRYAIISDIHANETALRAVLEDAKANGAESIVCLGDIVGYGPLPKECVSLVRSECHAVVAGNHDDAVSGRLDPSGFVDIAKEAVERHRAELSEDDILWLRSLPYVHDLGDGAYAAHGDMCDPPKFYYVAETRDAEANFAATNAQVIFLGHTHVPCLFITGRSGNVYGTQPQDFTIEGHKRYIVNPGSVGYPREANGQCLSSYVLYDSKCRTVVFRYLPFSVMGVMQRGTENGKKKRMSKSLVAAIVAASISVYTVAWLLTSKSSDSARDPRDASMSARHAEDGGESVVVREQTIGIKEGATVLRPNIVLGKGSVPLEVRIVFKDNDDVMVGDVEVDTVKKTKTRKFNIPKGATKAHIKVLKHRDGKEDIKSFNPEASER